MEPEFVVGSELGNTWEEQIGRNAMLSSFHPFNNFLLSLEFELFKKYRLEKGKFAELSYLIVSIWQWYK